MAGLWGVSVSCEVTVYTQDNCPPCKATKIYLLKNSIDFSEINLSRNPLIRDYLIEQSYRETPVVEWRVGEDSGSWSGFEPENIEALAYSIQDEQDKE